MALSLVTKQIKFADGSTGTAQFATDGTNLWPVSVLTDSNGALITDSAGLPAVLQAGTAIVGKFTTDQTTPGTTDLVHAAQNGTWTVQPGNTANTTPWLVDTGSGAGIAPIVSSTSETNHVFKSSPGNLIGMYAFSSVAGLVLGFDATSVPADGAVTPKWWTPIAANGVAGLSYVGMPPAAFSTGCCFCISSAASPFTKATPGAGVFAFSGMVK